MSVTILATSAGAFDHQQAQYPAVSFKRSLTSFLRSDPMKFARILPVALLECETACLFHSDANLRLLEPNDDFARLLKFNGSTTNHSLDEFD